MDEKYLDYINEDLNNLQIPFSNKITVLSLYFKNTYKNIKLNNKINLINKIQFDLCGCGITSYFDTDYYTKVKPYYTGESIDDDYLVYSFSFNSLEEQPTGFYSFDRGTELGIKTILNVIDEPVFIKILTKKYDFLNE